jgi:hypothetical protein
LNRKIGMYSSIVNIISVALFALCMLIKSNIGSYLVCMFIAFSFVPMICSFREYCTDENKAAGNTAMIFAGVYSVFILAVYFAQLTSVRLNGLDKQAAQIIDYQQYGLFFSYDLLGYGLMSLSTFFAGLTVIAKTKADKWLKWLLIIHGVFFFSCLILPMSGLFRPDMQGAAWIGTAVLEFWCLYFIPVGILSYQHFKRSPQRGE